MENKKAMEDQTNEEKLIFLFLYGAEEPDSMHIGFLSKEKGNIEYWKKNRKTNIE